VTVTSFKRAHSQEQRAERRQTILDTTAAMLTEMRVAQVSLNELSRRVGLAKSNVLRYFESREAVLLELLNTATRQWLDSLDEAPIDGTARERGEAMIAALVASLMARPVLCDLVSSQAAVLEHNVSPQIAAQYKRSAIANVGTLVHVILRHVPELGEHDATRFAAAVIMITGAIWAHSHPSAAMLAAYEADPELAAVRLDFGATLEETLQVLLVGLLAR
jgi:AcrR family transcriptional regulator